LHSGTQLNTSGGELKIIATFDRVEDGKYKELLLSRSFIVLNNEDYWAFASLLNAILLIPLFIALLWNLLYLQRFFSNSDWFRGKRYIIAAFYNRKAIFYWDFASPLFENVPKRLFFEKKHRWNVRFLSIFQLHEFL
jgi:hypothetical protein